MAKSRRQNATRDRKRGLKLPKGPCEPEPPKRPPPPRPTPDWCKTGHPELGKILKKRKGAKGKGLGGLFGGLGI